MLSKACKVLLVGFTGIVLLALSSSTNAGSQTVGLFLNEPGSFDGYTLFGAMRGANTYLIDNEGRFVHSWASGPSLVRYLLEDGSLLVGPGVNASTDQFVRRFAWDGTLLWEYEYTVPNEEIHHDVEMLPNGNVLIIAREINTGAEAIAAGRDPALLRDDELHALHVVEVEPTGPTSGDIVWEWRAWDHLVQEFDATKDNYGVVADHPELIDVNFIESSRPPEGDKDWHHTNSVDYNEALDQIMVSVRHFSEIWVIDHSTTKLEAASHSGGNSGVGGDLLYRWGNPQAYGAGDAGDQQLFWQHDSQWIAPGLPGAGNILIFNNGHGRPGPFSSVVEISPPPVDGSGNYALTPGAAFGPVSPTWEYDADFYAWFISGASRLPNGNTLITDGPAGTFVEVTPAGEIVWKYVSPASFFGPRVQGSSELFPGNIVFRAYRYSPSYSAFAGRDLSPGAVLEADTDNDGLTDRAEIDVRGTDPSLDDTDADGLSDGDEVRPPVTDPLNSDTDSDGLSDGDEVNAHMTDPLNSDTDSDGMPDGYEVTNGCLDPTTDDATSDADVDILTNLTEFTDGSDPCAADTDHDGLSDGDEVLMYGSDPTLADTDHDGLSDGDEIFIYGTDPLRAERLGDRLGDVNCDGAISSIDAALILQLTAGVVSFLFCGELGDVNGDGNMTSIDAAIILQFTAGLIPSPPP